MALATLNQLFAKDEKLNFIKNLLDEINNNSTAGLGMSFYLVVSGIVLFAVAAVLGATVRRNVPLKA